MIHKSKPGVVYLAPYKVRLLIADSFENLPIGTVVRAENVPNGTVHLLNSQGQIFRSKAIEGKDFEVI